LLPAGDEGPEALIYRLIILGLIRAGDGEEGIPAAADRISISGKIEQEIDELLIRFEIANHYEILSVPLDATKDQVHVAYHELARRYHPDRFESREYRPSVRSKAERLFTHITGAYTTLSDPAARANYDAVRLTKESQIEVTLQGRATTDGEKEKMAEALFRAGCNFLAEGDCDKAASHLRESVWLCPEIARYRHYLGVAQMVNPRLRKEAEQHLLKALELDRSRVDSRLELGKLYMSVNLPKKAEGELLEVLRWDPDNSTALGLLEELGQGGRAANRQKTPQFR
ncbi:MAG: tetratricopeptide repeat protein, partial [Acidobacteria bacterium]|nr:tetratricopeptide repeat protein [Acidobacteriota bacterium]